MRKAVTFMAIIDGVGKFFESYCIDRAEAHSQIAEIYTAEHIEIVLFQYV